MQNRESLRKIVQEKIKDDLFVVVSNREPYLHRWREGKVAVNKPASGVVTALDPMLQTCQGIWVAHGSGNADRKVVDEHNRIKVPPDDPQYTLRRVWLSKEEESGYYYGFSNQTFWPLCHISFARPSFEAEHWEIYQQVNHKFADAVLEEIGDRKAFVWVQDFHFALLPSYLKKRRPDLTVAQFWHIPWPTPEVFRICPWGKEVIEGMLGNDLIGFHTQLHCENFIGSVEQLIEARIERERSSTIYHHGGRGTKVCSFPISVDYEQIQRDVRKDYMTNDTIQEAMHALPEQREIIGVGVDRIDYTKGIPERIKAIDRFLTKYPDMVERFVFLQLGSQSRIHIGVYKQLNDEINQLIEQLNWKYASDSWQPVVFLRKNLTYPEILHFYRMAHLCIVSSLHDGMNLVAKEYVSSRFEEDGVLVLSKFTGAVQELESGSLVINPYDTEEFADILYQAVTMPHAEQQQRMRRMRETVAEQNIFNWGSQFISELASL